MRLLSTIGGVDFTGQERATVNRLTMPCNALCLGRKSPQYLPIIVPHGQAIKQYPAQPLLEDRLPAPAVNTSGLPSSGICTASSISMTRRYRGTQCSRFAFITGTARDALRPINLHPLGAPYLNPGGTENSKTSGPTDAAPVRPHRLNHRCHLAMRQGPQWLHHVILGTQHGGAGRTGWRS